MLRFFSLFGRSSELTAVDEALRKFGVHPLLLPEPVKLTLLKLQKTTAGASDHWAGFDDAAMLLAYCILGHDQFSANNGVAAADHADQRVATAIAEGDSLDSKLILLALHSGVICDELADRFDVDSQ